MADALPDYFRAATNGASMRAMADRIGMVHTTLADQLKKPHPPVQTVVALCRAYDLPLAPAFIAADFITEEEARTFSGPFSLAAATDLELSLEMVRRARQPGHELLHEPLGPDHPAMSAGEDPPFVSS